jgi:hypothetical protein
MTVYYPPDFEAEVLDLDYVPDEREFFPDDSWHRLGGYDGDVKLVGTRRKYKCLIRIGQDPTGMVGIDILTVTDRARECLAEHAEQHGLLKVTIGAITFTASIYAVLGFEGLTIGELFRKEPDCWGARGDPYLWSDMRDLLRDTLPPQNPDKLEKTIRAAFFVLTDHDMDERDMFFVERYDKGGMSSGHVSPETWRNSLLPLLKQRWLWILGWEKPSCPRCESEKVVRIEYGEPGFEMWEAYEKGEIFLGGCAVSPDDPDWHCRACEHQW